MTRQTISNACADGNHNCGYHAYAPASQPCQCECHASDTGYQAYWAGMPTSNAPWALKPVAAQVAPATGMDIINVTYADSHGETFQGAMRHEPGLWTVWHFTHDNDVIADRSADSLAQAFAIMADECPAEYGDTRTITYRGKSHGRIVTMYVHDTDK